MDRGGKTAEVISVNRTKTGTLQSRLAACRKAVERLDRVERRLGRIVAPYAARAVVEGLRLHLAGQDQYAHWRAFLERRGIVLRRSAKSPCQGAARLMLQHAPAATVNMYAHAMGWTLERLRKGHAEIGELAGLIVREGGVQAVARAFAKSVGGQSRDTAVSSAAFELAVLRLPRAGMLVGTTDIDADEVLALVRRDSTGRRVVLVVETDRSRVRSAVIRHTRRDQALTTDARKRA